MEKALVTGGAGFIGSNIAELLVEEGVEVVVLDSMYLGNKSNLESIREDIEIVEGSVLNEKDIEEAIEGCDTVFHMAARSSSPMHKKNPADGLRVNIEGFMNTVEIAKEEGVEKVVYASTSSMYGSRKPPHTEEMEVEPVNLYTASKMSREMYAKCYSYQEDIQTTGLRFFSVYGPNEKAKGEYANVVTQFLWKMQDDEKPVIWGDGTQERDFVFVKDVARANLKAAERREELDGEVFNIGTGNPVTFNQVVDNLNEHLGKNIEPEKIENPRDKYVHEHKADNAKAREILGWTPQNDFKEGLRKTVEYYS